MSRACSRRCFSPRDPFSGLARHGRETPERETRAVRASRDIGDREGSGDHPQANHSGRGRLRRPASCRDRDGTDFLHARAPRPLFDNPSWSGAPVSTIRDSVIHFDEDRLSERSAESDTLSVRWEGFVFAPKDSSYRFTLSSPGSSRVYLDDALLIDNGDRGPERALDKEIALSRGEPPSPHPIRRNRDRGALDFRWMETRTPKAIMPPLRFYSRPVTMSFFVLDTVASKISGILRAALIALGLLLLVVSARIFIPRWNPALVLTMILFLVLAGAYEWRIFSLRSTSASGCDPYAYLHGAQLMSENGFLRTEFSDPLAAEIYRSYIRKPSEADSIFLLSPHGYYVSDFGRGLVYNVFPPGMSFPLILS